MLCIAYGFVGSWIASKSFVVRPRSFDVFDFQAWVFAWLTIVRPQSPPFFSKVFLKEPIPLIPRIFPVSRTSFIILNAVAAHVHSIFTFSNHRNKNCRTSLTFFMIPNVVSAIRGRWLYTARASGVVMRAAVRSRASSYGSRVIVRPCLLCRDKHCSANGQSAQLPLR